MIKQSDKSTSEQLNQIIEAILEKKGKQIITIDLLEVDYAFSDYFVICQGDSTTQVGAIVDSIHRKLKTQQKVSPHHIEGKENSLWVLMDYVNILVHVFVEEKRSFYNLEELWADGKISRHDEK